MDAVTVDRPATPAGGAEPAALRPAPFAGPSFLPPESPLDMPVQSLRAKRVRGAEALRDATGGHLLGRRLLVFGSAIVLTGFAAYEMYEVLKVGGLTPLEAVVLGLFVVLFAWIGLAFTSALGGAIARLRGPDRSLGIAPDGPLPELSIRTALLMPTYNEEPGRVFAGLQAICESLEATGRRDRFDLFILSDTTDADVWVAEEAAVLALRERTGGAGRIFYRRRARNIDRKAGNIGEWVTRFGGAYEAMLVLDADSVMTGDCIVRLAAGMEASPRAGLIQTLPALRPLDCRGPRLVVGRREQLLGAQRGDPHPRLRRLRRPAASEGPQAVRRPYPQP